MGRITAEFILHREFVGEGEYNVKRGGILVRISVTRIQNKESMQKIMGQLESTGKVETTHDYHGVINISKVRITLPYHGQFGEPLEFKRECIPFLNRLLEAVRFKTRAYWITPLSEHDIRYFDIVENVDDKGKGTRGFAFVPDALIFPIQAIDQTKVHQDIAYILDNEIPIAKFELLFLDSYNYFAMSQFNLAVIIANTALEVFIEGYLKVLISEKYESEEQAKDKLSLALEGNLHKRVRRNFFKNIKHEVLLQSDQTYKKFDDFRQMRGRVVHNYEELKRDEAINAIMDIMYFVKHLEESKSDIADYL